MSTGSYPPTSNIPWAQLDEKTCSHPNHLPDFVLLYIPPGQTREYRCPGCGHITLMRSPDIKR